MTLKPYLGQPVIFTSKNGDGVQSPAVVLRTQDTTVPPEQIKAGPHEPGKLPEGFVLELESALHVDLLVHGLAKDYREYNVPHTQEWAPGSWAFFGRVNWPPKV